MIIAGTRPPSRTDLARLRDELANALESKDEPPEGEGLPAPRRSTDDDVDPAAPPVDGRATE